MHHSDLGLSLLCLSLNHKSKATSPFWPRDKTPCCDSQSKNWGEKQKAGRDRLEISIHLREEGCVQVQGPNCLRVDQFMEMLLKRKR